MPIVSMPGLRSVNMGELAAEMERDGDVIRVRAKAALDPYPRSLVDQLRHWARKTPDQIFLADRGPDGEWRKLTYARTLEKARGLAQAFLDRDLSVDRPIVVLSGNSIEHGLIALGAMMAGIAYAPVSPAYSLVSSDHSKLKHIFDLLTPGLVFVADGAAFASALDAVMTPDMELVVVRGAPAGRPATAFDDLVAAEPGDAVGAAEAAITGDTIAKFLFTSGSTGMPKAVINTHRMMACNQVMIATALAFLKDKPPVLVDWLPWNHTAGGNHNFGIALHNGGTLYIDDGNPTPAGILKTVRNLEEIAPTLYFNVPKGFEMLAEHLATNDRLRETFFSKVELLQYAGAGLAQHVWDALENLAQQTTGHKIMIVTGYGSTETAPFAFTTTWPVDRPGEVGLPSQGMEIKLMPDGEKLELRVKGPNVTPGYWRQPDKTAECFDEEGYYRIGDALKFVDPDDVNKGFLFDGRVSEDFKLSTGTWVNMAGVRAGLISACAPFLRDVVLTGLNANHVGALLLLDFDAARKLHASLAKADEKTVAHHPAVRDAIQNRFDTLAAKSTGSSNFVARAIILDTLPSIDKHEVTDKGSINQRAVMAARASLVDDLYAEPAPAHVLIANRKAKS